MRPCASLPQQLLDYARQFEQLQNEITTAEQEILNTIKLPGTIYRDLTGDIQQIQAIAQQANMLSGQMGTMINNLSVSAAGGYPTTGPNFNWHQWMSNEDAAVGLTMKTAAQVLNLQPTMLSTHSSILAALNTQALGTGGRQATLQSLAGSLSTLGQGVQVQQSTIATALQALISYQTTERDQDAVWRRVNDSQQEAAWVNECAALASFGGSSPNCQ
jgi:conjugal transfer/entry exclusion protein